MNLDNILPSGRSQSRKTPSYVVQFVQNVQNRPVYGQRKQVRSCQRLGLEWGVRASGDGVSFWDEKNVLKLTVTMVAQL